MANTNRAVVVGAGPNGLVAALTLAKAGFTVTVFDDHDSPGGGVRTQSLGLASGITHDLCSAIHPLALASPIFREINLPELGVEFIIPEISYAQPVGNTAAFAYRDLARTAEGLGVDGKAWQGIFSELVAHADTVIDLIMGPRGELLPTALRPANLGTALRLVMRVLEQGSAAWNVRFKEELAPALLTGVAAHAIAPLPSLAASGTALMLAVLAHSHGWPVPKGGSVAITNALVRALADYDVQFALNTTISDRKQLPPADLYLFDATPQTIAQLWEAELPSRFLRAFRSYRFGPGVAKLDLVVNEPIPWTTPQVGQAATVHVAGTRAEMSQAESQVHLGKLPDHPMVLVSEPANHDPSRQVGSLRPVWAYAHVPHGLSSDASENMIAQIERFAPGFRDTIVAMHSTPASAMPSHSLNYVGGDIAAGLMNVRGIVARPRMAANPYRTGIPGVYLCSAATPPGPGVHGMSGFLAAKAALKDSWPTK